jgi:hypothetical protein
MIMEEETAVKILGDKLVMGLMVLGVFVAFAQAKDKDHSADYQVGTFSSTGTISDGSYASCSGGGLFGLQRGA